MITSDNLGGRTVDLFIPFDHNGKKVTRIVFAAFRFGDSIRWTDGEFESSLALLVELSGVDESVIRSIRFPDVERVMEVFMAMIPANIREDIANDRIPVRRTPLPVRAPYVEEPPHQEEVHEEVHEEPVTMRGPGEPLPEAGFDLSEEP